MARVYNLKNNFSGGIITSELYGRQKLKGYENGLKSSENMLVSIYSGITSRSGSIYLGEVKDSTKKTRVITFPVNSSTVYELEFGHNYIRFIDASTKAYVMSSGSPYEIATTYTQNDVDNLIVATSADVMYITCDGFKPRELKHFGATNWTISDSEFIDGPYLFINTDSTKTMTPSATTGSGVTLTASSSTFVSTDVGRHIRLKHNGKWGWAKIASYTSSTVVTIDIKHDFNASVATVDWRLGAWSDTTSYPKVNGFAENRLFFANYDQDPSRVWASNSDDYTGMLPSEYDGVVAGDNSLNFPITSGNRVNDVSWLMAGTVLSIGADAGENSVSASSGLNEPLKPDNIKVKPETNRGSFIQQPLKIDNRIVFIQKGKRKIFQYNYDFQSEGFIATDLTLLCSDIAKGGVEELSYQKERDSIIWARKTDGTLLSGTYDPSQSVNAWTTSTLGGNSDSNGTHAIVESIATADVGSTTTVFMVVKRYINGATKRYIEYFPDPFGVDTNSPDKADAHFLDCGVIYDGASTTSITGLSHLEGESVSILADGIYVGEKTVVSGAITLDNSASKVHVGYKFNRSFELLDPEIQLKTGTSQGRIKSYNDIVIRFLNTIGCSVGYDKDNTDEILFRVGTDPITSSPPLYTGFMATDYNGDYDREAPLYLENNQPYPFTVLSIVMTVDVNEA